MYVLLHPAVGSLPPCSNIEHNVGAVAYLTPLEGGKKEINNLYFSAELAEARERKNCIRNIFRASAKTPEMAVQLFFFYFSFGAEWGEAKVVAVGYMSRRRTCPPIPVTGKCGGRVETIPLVSPLSRGVCSSAAASSIRIGLVFPEVGTIDLLRGKAWRTCYNQNWGVGSTRNCHGTCKAKDCGEREGQNETSCYGSFSFLMELLFVSCTPLLKVQLSGLRCN
ncbi:uncharacterized protein KNAG_0E04260 [Huiozyma naganishii CBS 8797]|uniref:Uncharacterized protein n=1 Tax=Huiozyma naganishii (strain ATCC MYA-139 / BCRC 22969 / CBS 8797 / KCTC 17520 / NBRC 10181 / NCYC 3082 / Yp74L-3) TaxID=1071383 RepID=J7S6Z4_HUIN7|nr:hypothetical protein KNAG_0E04260 [Kazachstania naganishii CBS 8797]CCK70679.1 hypothetical protein KNAG_0E04260 [Kazachstania naganishii CBS 8797]